MSHLVPQERVARQLTDSECEALVAYIQMAAASLDRLEMGDSEPEHGGSWSMNARRALLQAQQLIDGPGW